MSAPFANVEAGGGGGGGGGVFPLSPHPEMQHRINHETMSARIFMLLNCYREKISLRPPVKSKRPTQDLETASLIIDIIRFF